MIERLAYAKINLFLDIEGIRQDGYHNIVSVMQTVDWVDRILLDKADCAGIHVTCSEPSIPTNRNNTVYKAAELFLEKVKCDTGLRIHIEKHLPSEAGLAGGSADAAATLSGLNELFGNPFTAKEILSIAKRIGADVPFCLLGGTQKTTGIGDVIEAFPPMPSCYIVCAKMGAGVSTPQAYRLLDQAHDGFKAYCPRYDRLEHLSSEFKRASLDELTDGIYNIFESAIEASHPTVHEIKQFLLSMGANAAMMSGSGPSVFGIFQERSTAEAACLALKNKGAVCQVCRPIQITNEGDPK